MQRILLVPLITVAIWFAGQRAIAQDAAGKKPAAEFPPAPKQLGAPETVVPEIIVLPQMPRLGTREQWQYYGVDAFGRFRPRVILSPYGSYYMQTGQPYPWINNRSTAFMPYALD